MFKILLSFVAALMLLPGLASASVYDLRFNITFDDDACVASIEEYDCSDYDGFYSDLTGGETSIGRIGFGDSGGGWVNPWDISCADMFGRSCDFFPSTASFSETLDGVMNLALGQDPGWMFMFDGDSGSATYFTEAGFGREYSALFSLSEVTAVPLPASLRLMLAGLAGFAFWRRKSRPA